MVLHGEIDYEPGGHRHLERREDKLHRHLGHHHLQFLRVAGEPHDNLAHIHPSEKFHRLRLHMPQEVAPQICHRLVGRPRQAVDVDIGKKQPQNEDERDHDRDQKEHAALHIAFVVGEAQSRLAGQHLCLMVPAGEPWRRD